MASIYKNAEDLPDGTGVNLLGLDADGNAVLVQGVDELIAASDAAASTATTQAGIATTQAGNAAADAAATAADVIAADAAVVLAEAARDSSFANAKGDTTIALARARVADGETFIVYAADALTYDAYRRESSSTQTFLGVYPAPALIDQKISSVYVQLDRRVDFEDTSLSGPATVFIQKDEEYGDRSTVSAFDGWTLHLLQILPWTPQALLGNDERGIVYDPSDYASTWQDRAFAVPARAGSDPVAVVLDSSGSRPAITERKNLRKATDDPRFGDWTLSGTTAPVLQQGVRSPLDTPVYKTVETAANSPHGQFAVTYAFAGGDICYWRVFKAAEWSRVRLQISTLNYSDFDLAAGTVLADAGLVTGAITDLGDGYYRAAISGTLGALSLNPSFWVLNDSGTYSRVGDISKGILISSEQLELGLVPTSYQKVGSATAGWIAGAVAGTDTDSKRPLLIVDGRRRALRTDGTNDALIAEAVDLSGADGVTTFAFTITRDPTGTLCVPICHGWLNFTSAVSSSREILLDGSYHGSVAGVMGAAGQYLATRATNPVGQDPYACIVEFDPLNSDSAERVRIWINGFRQAATNYAAVGTPGVAAASDVRPLSLGARDGTTLFAACDLNAFFAVNRALSDEERQLAFAWLGNRGNVLVPGIPGALSFSATPEAAQFSDTVSPEYTASPVQFYKTSAFARVAYDTEAVGIRINSFSDVATAYPLYSEIAVYVDGRYYHSTVVGNGAISSEMALPPGRKRVEFVNGLQSRPASSVLGTYVASIDADAPLVPIAPATAGTRYLIYGDSIAVGANALTPGRFGWGMQLRTEAESMTPRRSVQFEAFGGRSLWDDCKDGAARAAFVAKIVAINPTDLWLAMGTNDYGLNRWAAAAFGTAYAALLDDLHTALPALTIYAQTPITRSVETANGSGSTLGDYRTQISSAASTRSAFVTLVDGTAWSIILADGVHPTSFGMTAYVSGVKSALGW